MDQESESQVVARERPHVLDQTLRRPQPPEGLRRDLGTGDVMAHERHPPAVGHATRLRLCDVVEQRAEPQRVAAAQLVRERLRQHRANGIAILADSRGGVTLELDRRLEDGQRVSVHVEVVEAALLHPAQLCELGQHDLGRTHGVEQRHAPRRAVGADDSHQLVEHPLGRYAHELWGMRARRAGGLRINREPELASDPRESHHSQRVALERLRRHHPQRSGVQVLEAAERIHGRPARERLRDRVDREISLREIVLDRLARQRDQVELPIAIVSDDPPHPEPVRQPERVSARLARERPRKRLRVTFDRDVEVGRRPAQRPVARRAPDEPCCGRPDHPPERRDRVAHPTGSPSRW